MNPFTGKEHYDTVDDDKFLAECFQGYYNEIRKTQLLDNTPEGQMVIRVATKLIRTVEDYLIKLGRYDYVDGYYEWEVHLTANREINACCMPGGKILVYQGIFSIANTEERLAFILGHEMAHALLDHGRTKYSSQSTKNGLVSAAFLGSFALDLIGLGEVGAMTRAATNVIDLGSHFFLMQPWGRDQEYEADKLGMFIAYLAGYDIREVPKFWREFAGEKANGMDFFSTHPSDEKRIAVMVESEEEILSRNDFFSRPLLPETPKPKGEYSQANRSSSSNNSSFSQNNSNAAAFTDSNPKGNVENIRCPNCGSLVGMNDTFCVNCGNKLEQALRCNRCGAPVNSDDAFCFNCGNKLSIDLKCSNCGSKVSPEDSFCTNCGNRL